MRLRKVTLDEREVLRKYRLQSNANVSFWHDEFDCGAQASIIRYTKSSRKREANYGVGKREHKISQRHMADIFKGTVNGG